MPFPESILKKVKQAAHFQCCLCKTIGIEIHHIIPRADGGSDAFDNAAPLCPSCHETYGANPTKRKFIREARDFWYEICDKRFAADTPLLKEIQKAVSNAASKEDISELRVDLKKAGLKLIKSKALQSVPIPRKDSKSERREMDIRDVLVLLCATPSDRPSKQIEILCLRELWPVKDGYRSIYKNFIKRFGERLLRLLATRTLDEIGVLVVDEGLTEGEISAAVHLMSIEAVCISSLDNGEFLAALNNEDEIIYRLKDSDEEH